MSKILAVDDDLNVVMVYRDLLSHEGHEFYFAEDPVGGLSKYEETKPDLVLLDFEMPAGGGMAFFNSLRGRMVKPVPVIFITAHDEKDIGFALKLHKVGYLKKPFTKEDFLEKVASALKP